MLFQAYIACMKNLTSECHSPAYYQYMTFQYFLQKLYDHDVCIEKHPKEMMPGGIQRHLLMCVLLLSFYYFRRYIMTKIEHGHIMPSTWPGLFIPYTFGSIKSRTFHPTICLR